MRGTGKWRSFCAPTQRRSSIWGAARGWSWMRFTAGSRIWQVVGVDLTQAMLDRLKQKHPDKRLTLICGDYFQAEFGEEQFDAAVSFETMHHFAHAPKRALYQKICAALKADGVYLECDYMVETQEEEDALYAERVRLHREFTAEPDTFYHIDTPCTVENQIRLLQEAGFSSVKLMFRLENTTLLLAKK